MLAAHGQIDHIFDVRLGWLTPLTCPVEFVPESSTHLLDWTLERTSTSNSQRLFLNRQETDTNYLIQPEQQQVV